MTMTCTLCNATIRLGAEWPAGLVEIAPDVYAHDGCADDAEDARRRDEPDPFE